MATAVVADSLNNWLDSATTSSPVPDLSIQWDGRRGCARWICAWTTAQPDNLQDFPIVDISTLSPAPSAIKVRLVHIVLNGAIQADF
jgi:hypothetical protein